MWSTEYLNRASYTATSIHQTYVGKALFEHAPKIATIAAVASVSPIFRNSSLGPNLLALLDVDDETINLFSSVFSATNTLQFSNTLSIGVVCHDLKYARKDPPKFISLFSDLITRSRYFARSIKKLTLNPVSGSLPRLDLSLIGRLVALEQLDLEVDSSTKNFSFLSQLLHLKSIDVEFCGRLHSSFFESLGDLAEAPTSAIKGLVLSDSSFVPITIDHKAFQQQFCRRVLAKDRLTTLKLARLGLNESDYVAITNAEMKNIEHCSGIPFRCLLKCDKLKEIEIQETNDEEIVQIANRWEDSLETLNISQSAATLGDFWTTKSPPLYDRALLNVKTLVFDQFPCFDRNKMNRGFNRLASLENAIFSNPDDDDQSHPFNGVCLDHLPHPQKLKSIEFSSCAGVDEDFFKILAPPPSILNRSGNNINKNCQHKPSKFINLEEVKMHSCENVDLCVVQLRFLPNLKRLEMIYCKSIPASGFVVLSKSLPNIVEFTANSCCRFSVGQVKEIVSNLSKFSSTSENKFVRLYNRTLMDLDSDEDEEDEKCSITSMLEKFCTRNYPLVVLDCQYFGGDTKKGRNSKNEEDMDDSDCSWFEDDDESNDGFDDTTSDGEEEEEEVKPKRKSSSKPKPKKATKKMKKAKTTPKSKPKVQKSKKQKKKITTTKPKTKSKASKFKLPQAKKAAPKKASGRRRQRGE